jgi:uncharacterized protein (TIGR00288 family)
MRMDELKNIALLIDADNTRLSLLESVLSEISAYGRIVVKRAYGNWKKDSLKNWEGEIKRLAIRAQQQFDYVAGKNATDIALVIDAINLLHTGIYDGFVLISSDSDYTPLAINLHESGKYVIGVGEKKTPESFRNSCDEFIFLENLSKNEPAQSEDKKTSQSDIHRLLRIAWEKYQDDDGYVNLGAAGSYIKRAKPDTDLRTYGYTGWANFLEAYPKKYSIRRTPGKGNATIVSYQVRG